MAEKVTMREVVLSAIEQYDTLLQRYSKDTEVAFEDGDLSRVAFLGEQSKLVGYAIAVLKNLINFDQPEVIVYIRNGWVSRIDGLPDGIRWIVVEEEINAK